MGLALAKLSKITAARMMEEKMAADGRYRKQITRSGRPTLSALRQLTDEQLAEMVSALGLEVRREGFAALAAPFLSAEALADHLTRAGTIDTKGWNADKLWMGLCVLWERWLPHQPSFEMLDDWMQAGYLLLTAKEPDPAGACEKWLGVWSALLRIMDSEGMRSLEEFDREFRGTQWATNYVQDLEEALWNAGLGDKRYWERGIEFTTQYLERFAGADQLMAENMRRALATFHAGLSRQEQADQLFRDWLQQDPIWGWGWIGWSDCYRFASEKRDPERAERILRDGLAVAGVQDRVDLLDRLATLLMDQGREQEAAEAHAEMHALQDRPGFEAVARPVPAKSTKVGRNVPCPCGSGKKYKRCCGSMV
jgi:hypothetical protein